MFELTIDNQVYQFRFGFGFLKEINKRVSIPVEKMPGVKQNLGLRWAIAQIMDGNLETLVDVLEVANKGENPRLTRGALEDYVEDEGTDIDQLFADVLDFFKKSNCTRKTIEALEKDLEQAEAQERDRS